MRCFIRRILRRKGTGSSHKDTSVEVEALTVGRATDQHIFLSDLNVSLTHAVLKSLPDGRMTVQSKTLAGVRINGNSVQAGIIGPGDVLGVGRSELHIFRPPAGHDVAIAVEESRQQAGGLRETGPRSLREAGLHRRRWSWALLVMTLAVTLAWPAWQVWQRQTPRANATTPETAAREGALLPFTADRLWDPGRLARAHQFFAGQCEHCHQTPFIRVTDNACLSCHRGLAQHSDHVGLLRSSGLAARRCTDCHFEHRGNMGLVADSPVLCTSCHGSDRPFLRQAGLRPVNGFSTDHPEFRAAVKSLDDMGRVKVSRISLDDSPSQPTGLIFRHDKHLVADGVKGPDGRKVVMTCADCHHPEGRGADMR
ncbi:MAG: cytochrome c3 family protein, partial [Gammaproteobacteria bacterium]